MARTTLVSRLMVLLCLGLSLAVQAKRYDDFEMGDDDGVRWEFHAPGRVVAIGDIHGDPNGLFSIFRFEKLIDGMGNWIGGNAQVVMVGDILDRGPDSRSCLDWLAQWAKQAEAKGGAVHRLLGNHETMVATGDYSRYLSRKDAPHYKKFATIGLPRSGYLNAMTQPTSPYARELHTRNALIRVDNTLFVHGGVGDWLLGAPRDYLGRVNGTIRGVLGWYQDFFSAHGGPAFGNRPDPIGEWTVRGDEGPLWSRTLAKGDYSFVNLHTILKQQGLERIVIGHTPTSSHLIEESYGGKVFHIDTNISQFYPDGKLSALEIVAKSQVQKHNDIPRLKNTPTVWRKGNPDLQGYYH